MKVLIDVMDHDKIPHFGVSTDICSVDSSGVSVLSCEEDDRSQVRAEYLYKTCVDGGIELAVVEDVEVAEALKACGVDVVHAV